MNRDQEVNKVYKTDNLNKFKQIDGNRPQNIQHVRRLSHSIKANGILQNPIIVNENMYVIDGQHRLLAAKEAQSCIFYIIVSGYNLDEIHALNLNQKNWSKKDFMEGYADMGIIPYVKLRNFSRLNKDFSLTDCVSLCSNTRYSSSYTLANKHRSDKPTYDIKEVFEEGTWIGRDFDLAQEYADMIRMAEPYYKGYKRSKFVSSMIGLFQNENFNNLEFLNKLKLQPTKLVDCVTAAQYTMLIEDIYNYRRRDKVNLRY